MCQKYQKINGTYKPQEMYTTSWRTNDDSLARYILECSDYAGIYVIFRLPENVKYYELRYARYGSYDYAKRITQKYNATMLIINSDRTFEFINWS
jgi:hypothetical protein